MTPKLFHQLSGQVVKAKGFKHIFALNIDKTGESGLIRCITRRTGGNITFAGTIDKSELYLVSGKPHSYRATKLLIIKNQDKILKRLTGKTGDILGLEDPDIFYDPENKITHLYFTIPVLKNNTTKIYLGHAQGSNIHNLEMTDPVLLGGKEVCIMPKNSHNLRLNLVESSKSDKHFSYSTIRIARCLSLDKKWTLDKTIFYPKKGKINWLAGHASPGPIIPKEFYDPGKNKILCLLNGRSASAKTADGKTLYGPFKVGLAIYDYEVGRYTWISKEPLIFDTKARTITFASQFVMESQSIGVVYAHVDDSFVRGYQIDADSLKNYLQTNSKFVV